MYAIRSYYASFPVAINISGIETSDTGILTISYHVPVNPPQTDADSYNFV